MYKRQLLVELLEIDTMERETGMVKSFLLLTLVDMWLVVMMFLNLR